MRALVFVALCASLAVGDPQCDLSSALEKFDCFPQDSSNEEECIERGCCWRDTNEFNGEPRKFPPLSEPFCYYPRNYQGYKVLNQTSTEGGLVVYLERVFPSLVDVDISLIRVEVIHQSDEILRIRFVDPLSRRWEPPLPAPPPPKENVIPKYVVRITDDTRLEVTRFIEYHGGNKLIDLDLASLVYTDHFLQISSRLPSNVVYGLGEHKGSLRRSTNFSRFTFYNEDRAPEYNARLYGTHPFYINIEPDGQANGMWLLNSNAMDIILQPTPAITYRPVGGILDFFLFVGPSPANVVEQYQQMIGKPKMIPYWSLGFHLCRFGYKGVDHTRQILRSNLDAGVRIDVQWNDIDYMEDRNDFTLDKTHYKDLGSFVDELHRDGRHYVLIIDPAVSGSEEPGAYPPYDRGLDYDVFVKDAKGQVVRGKVWNRKSSVFPDFTHPNSTAYWTEMISNFHEEVAIDGAWIDMNEPSNMIDGHMDEGCPSDFEIVYTPGDEPLKTKTLCMSDRHYWSEHYNVHNMYGFTEAIATYHALAAARPRKRPFIISRSSFSGHGFYAGHWTGDVFSTWTDLKDSVPGFLEFSFYGIPMVGVDICGFNGNTTVDLCARWHALGAFYPFSRNHNTDDALAQDPASLGEKVVTVTKNAYYWRYKLLPHLYTLFYRAHVDGDTVARPLFFEYPRDSNTYDIDEQFLWGDSLMVVPALHENQKTINAYFPRGIWYDLQNRTATVDAPLQGKYITIPAYEDTINFFMRGGRAVFYQEPGDTTTDSREKPYGLYIFLSHESYAMGELYIDDGESIDAVENRENSLITVLANDREILLGNESRKPIDNQLDRIHFYGVTAKPTGMTVNYQPFTDFQYDASRQILTIYNMDAALTFITITITYP
ncbi:lysosomal alpha-glucosidase [Galendromus occidentalis]|uniref:Lysosomal alpha-glucosidase n=1 Tax=Galendromus occidentalis TaxID=34638 RepID=A0AAJ7WHU6_9ACAR|nr:lysosomal alpha-glucosidase [Galendromus occidentalis]